MVLNFLKIFSKHPLHPDAFEKEYVYVATANQCENNVLNEDPGEGLFLKKEVFKEGTLLAFYNGIRKRKKHSSFQGRF